MCDDAALAPAWVVPAFKNTTGLALLATDSVSKKRLPSDTPSRYMAMTRVSSSCASASRKSLSTRSALLPMLTSLEKPTASERAQSTSEVQIAPDWLMTPILPFGGILRAKVAFSGRAVFIMPRQLGPSSLMPPACALSTASRSSFLPSIPTSLNPAEMITAPATPRPASSDTVSGTCTAGTTITARSSGSGTSWMS